MKSITRFIFVLAVVWMALGTIRAKAGGYYWLYTDLGTVYCGKSSSLGIGPYFAYFGVNISANYPAGAMLHRIVVVNGSVTSDTWTVLPIAFSGTLAADRIDSPTPNYTAKKLVQLWVGGTLRSETEIYAECFDKRTGTWGAYGSIVEAVIF